MVIELDGSGLGTARFHVPQPDGSVMVLNEHGHCLEIKEKPTMSADGIDMGNLTPEEMEKLQQATDRFEKDQQKKEAVGDGAAGGGLRYNKGKNMMELTPPEWEWALADVTTQGSKKYAARNWEQGMKWSTMVGCMKRHINKFLAGERYDGEEFDIEEGTTGCHHLAMVAWNALALMSYDLREIGENDLPDLQLELFERVNAGTSDMGGEVHPKPPIPTTARAAVDDPIIPSTWAGHTSMSGESPV